MKIISREILPFIEKVYFFAIRNKVDYAKLIALATRLLLLDYKDEEVKSNSWMKLVVDRMCRLFFYKKNKIFSVAYPFTIQLNLKNEIESITSKSGRNIDFKNISAMLSVLESEEFINNPSLIDFYIEPYDITLAGVFILEELFLVEPAYIRYDCDNINKNGRLHPLHHLDINYSSDGTYKLGLNNQLDANELQNLLNLNTDCCFLNN